MLRSALLDELSGVAHGLTTRVDGSVGPLSDPAATATRARIVTALGGDPARLVAARQVHGARVAVVRADGVVLGAADGVATTEIGLPLMVQGADCPLIALVDRAAPALALVHSGWRGTVARIAAGALEALRELGARPERVRAALFPGIGPCCFEVGPEVIAAVYAAYGMRAAAWHAPSARAGHALLDLHAAIAATLEDGGVPPAGIDRLAGCTACGGRLWSHRASAGRPERHGLFALLDGRASRA